MSYQFLQGDVVEWARKLPDQSVDAIFCDPPYGLGKDPDMANLLSNWLADQEYDTGGGFMGKAWDVVPGPALWRALWRVAKPGAYLLAFGGTRTADLLSLAMRLAGWKRWDEILWVYSSGYPKSMDMGMAIDKARGAEREVILTGAEGKGNKITNAYGNDLNVNFQTRSVPTTDAAKHWAGYGSALKPAYEPVLCFRKPVDGNYAHNALTWGCGGLNIDACRIGEDELVTKGKRNGTGNTFLHTYQTPEGWTGGVHQGRWPANFMHDGSADVLEHFPQTAPSKAGHRGAGINGATFAAPAYASTVRGHDDGGGSAARFFYCSKASKRERNAGLDDLPERATHRYGAGIGEGLDPDAPVLEHNHHPCVKPLTLCAYLSKLLLVPEPYRGTARLLIPFAGSHSEAIGAALAGWRNITAIERDSEYCEIGQRRFEWWTTQMVVTGLSDPSAILAQCGKKDREILDSIEHSLGENPCQTHGAE